MSVQFTAMALLTFRRSLRLAGVCCLALASICHVAQAAPLTASWQQIGPSEQDVLSVAQSPVDPRALLVATRADGIFHSGDGGASWQPAQTNLATIGPVSWIGFNPQRQTDALALVNGLPYLSHDGGGTWSEAAGGLRAGVDLTTADFPSWGHLVFAGGQDGLYRSSDGGSSWQRLSKGLSAARAITFVVSSPVQPGRVLLGVSYNEIHGGRVYRSDTSGDTWQELDHGLSPDRPPWIAAWSTTRSDTAWVAAGNIYRTDNGGKTWQPDGFGLPPYAAVQALAHLGGSGLAAVLPGAVYVRLSPSSSWQLHPVPWPAAAPVHQVVTATDGSALVATGGGLYELDGASLQWRDRGSGLPSRAYIYSLASDGSTVYAGGDNTVWQLDSQGGWESTGDGLPTGANVRALVVLPGPPRRLLCATDYGLYASFAGSGHWTIVPGALAGHAVGALTYAPATDVVYASAIGAGVYAAPASSLDWHPLPGSFQIGDVHVLAAGGDGSWLLANDERTANSGRTWQPTGLTGTLTALAVAGSPPVMLAGTAAHGLYRSVDRGMSWTRVAGVPPDANVPVLAVAGTASAPLVYAVANERVVVSTDAGSDWHLVASTPSGVLLSSVLVQGGAQIQILAGSAGGGVFQLGAGVSLPVASPTPSPTLSPAATISPTPTHVATPSPSPLPVSATATPSATVPGGATATPSATPSPSPTTTDTWTPTLAAPSPTPSRTATTGPAIR